MPSSILDDPEHWRNRAEEARSVSHKVSGAPSGQTSSWTNERAPNLPTRHPLTRPGRCPHRVQTEKSRQGSATGARVFEAGECRSARRSPRYRHSDGRRMGTLGGRRRAGARRAATAADSARRQEGIGRLSWRPRPIVHASKAAVIGIVHRTSSDTNADRMCTSPKRLAR
jgi:hypothetical protein